jgi:hypothetical protein
VDRPTCPRRASIGSDAFRVQRAGDLALGAALGDEESVDATPHIVEVVDEKNQNRIAPSNGPSVIVEARGPSLARNPASDGSAR